MRRVVFNQKGGASSIACNLAAVSASGRAPAHPAPTRPNTEAATA